MIAFVLGVFVFGAPLATVYSILGNSCRELTYRKFFQEGSIHAQLGYEWVRKIENHTNNKIEIHYFSGGPLLKWDEIFIGLLRGFPDIGMS